MNEIRQRMKLIKNSRMRKRGYPSFLYPPWDSGCARKRVRATIANARAGGSVASGRRRLGPRGSGWVRAAPRGSARGGNPLSLPSSQLFPLLLANPQPRAGMPGAARTALAGRQGVGGNVMRGPSRSTAIPRAPPKL